MSRLPAAFLGPPIAHRALHDAASGRPENTRGAIVAAIEAGYGIEIDVQPSAEGVPMVFHDEALYRLCGRPGLIADTAAVELAGMAVQGTRETIPRLADVLALVAGKVPILVEIKDQTGVLGPVDGGFERAVAAELAAYLGPVAAMSFNPHAVAVLAEAAPGVARGLVTCSFPAEYWPGLPRARAEELARIPDAEGMAVDFISHQHSELDAPRVRALRAGGLPVLCWTVRSAEAEAQARLGADNITFEGYAAEMPSS